MEPQGSLPCSQEHVIGPCPERDESSTHHLIPSAICKPFNIPLSRSTSYVDEITADHWHGIQRTPVWDIIYW